MSDDLISREALMEKTLQEEYDNDIHKDGRAKAIHHGEYQHFYKTISEMPTAYDVDKVIQKITELQLKTKDKLLEVEDEEYAVMLRGQLRGIADCLEIVKSGGDVND
jgi:hypothetical protein